jgi:recombinational DNA repair protein RecR
MICFICHQQPDVEHQHHPVLQAAGGKNSGTITLCSNCHNSVHSEINRLCAAYRKGKGGACSVNWSTCRHSQEVHNATNVVLTGVQSMLTYDGEKSGQVNIKLPPAIHQTVLTLKQKTGAKSMPEVILACIEYTARHSGLV